MNTTTKKIISICLFFAIPTISISLAMLKHKKPEQSNIEQKEIEKLLESPNLKQQ